MSNSPPAAAGSDKGSLPALQLRLSDLGYTVPLQANNGSKDILRGIDFKCDSGKLSAIMGPSGAGKTTLLNLLAGDRETVTIGRMQGGISLNGQPCRPTTLKGLSAYVRQADVLLSTSTVRESLMFHTLLQLPRTLPYAVKAARVQEIIDQLGLSRCADTLIGDDSAGIKGISGGERRRVALGVELVKEPAILFLDEPTSGLDSEMALQVVTHLKRLAVSMGRMVVFTIHQPNSDITDLFDELLLLSPGGRSAYSGAWSDALGHFSSLGYDCPLYKNPADYYMWMLNTPDVSKALADAWEATLIGTKGSTCKALACTKAGPGAKARQIVVSAIGRRRKQRAGLLSIEGVSDTSSGTHIEARDQDGSADSSAGASGSREMSEDLLPGSPSSASSSSEYDEASSTEQSSDRSSLEATRLVLSVERSAGASEKVAEAPVVLHTAQNPNGDAALVFAPLPYEGDAPAKRVRPPMWYEVWVLSGRCIRWWYRNPNMLMAEVIQYLFSALFLASIYPRVGLLLNHAADYRQAALFMCVVAAQFTAPARSVIIWAKEKGLMRWELSAGAYRLPSYFLARMLTSLPLEALQIMVITCIYYFFVGFQATAAKFFMHMMFMILVAANSCMMGHLVAVFAPDISYAMPLQVMVNTVLCAFTGFLITDPPVYWRWLYRASYLSYAYQGLVRNELEGLVFTSPTTLEGYSTNAYQANIGKTLAKLVPKTSKDVLGTDLIPSSFLDVSAQDNLGIVALFALGLSVLAFVSTVLMVRVRKQL